MSEPSVTVQFYTRGLLDHTEEHVLSDALSHASDWMEQQMLTTGVGLAQLIGDLSKCPNRVDQTHQPLPVSLVGSTLTYSCSDCAYTGTMTVGTNPATLVWAHQ